MFVAAVGQYPAAVPSVALRWGACLVLCHSGREMWKAEGHLLAGTEEVLHELPDLLLRPHWVRQGSHWTRALSLLAHSAGHLTETHYNACCFSFSQINCHQTHHCLPLPWWLNPPLPSGLCEVEVTLVLACSSPLAFVTAQFMVQL